MAFPLFVGKKGKEIFKKMYARDHSVIHDGKPYAPFKHRTTKATTTTIATETPASPPPCMNVNVDLEFAARPNEESVTVTCPSTPTTTKEKYLITPTPEVTTTEEHTTEAMTSTNEVTTSKTSSPEEIIEPSQLEDTITTTACPTAPTCSEEVTVTAVTCPTVTGCIKRKRLKHTLPLNSIKPFHKSARQHTSNTGGNQVKNTPEEMRYEDEYYGKQTETLRHFLRNNYPTRPTTPIHTIKDYYYYYYFF